MNVVKENINEFGALLKVQVAKNDYDANVKKTLNGYRRKAEIKGFRVGMAPMSLIQKMYGRSVMLDEVNKIVSESLTKFINDEKLDILGEPIPSDEQQQPIDWDTQDDFELVYEIAYSPKVEVSINKRLKVPFYNIQITDEDVKKQVDNLQQRHGKLEEGEEIGKEDMFKADLNQEGENAINIEDTYISMRQIENDKQRKPFLKLKVGDSIDVDLSKVYPKEETLAAALKVKKEELADINPNFKVTVKEIKTFKKAKVNQELFDAAYGKDAVKSKKEFEERVSEEIAKAYAEESDYRFSVDAREKLLDKAAIELPKDFLKRWLLLINEGKLTTEQIDNDFDAFAKDLSWQIIRDKIVKDNDLKIEAEDVKKQAINLARYQLMQYGLSNLPDEEMDGFAQRILEDKKQARGLTDKAIEEKVFEYLKNAVALDPKDISVEDFGKLYETKK